MTQTERILDYMKENGSITQMEAMTQLGIYRLGARIWDLKKSGANIKKEMASEKTRYGTTTYFARYRLEN